MSIKNTGLLTALACAFAAAVACGATITNPSFEADTFDVAPGSIADNGTIAGWTASDGALVGLNPAGGTNVFANNGVVPDGTNVAYIQGDDLSVVNLSTTLGDLDIGTTYKVDFRLNASLNQRPKIRVTLDGNVLVGMETTHAGGTAAYRYAAVLFDAAATNHTLTLHNVTLTDNQTALVDDFQIAAYTGGWSFAAWRDDASSDISSNRVYTHAYSFGSTNSGMVNGVLFTGVAGANPNDPGRFSTAGYASTWGRNGLDTDDNVITRAGGGSAVIAGQFVFNGLPESLTIRGLVPGVAYVATLYSVAWDPDYRSVVFNVGEDRLTINQDHFGTDEGIRVSYRYVASDSGSITLSASRYTDRSFHLYGFSNYTEQQAPFIGVQPRSQVVAAGNTSYLRVLAEGAPPLAHQWRKDGGELAGETNATLQLDVTGAGDAGAYAVVVTNTYGAVTSGVAAVSLGMIANPGFEAETFYGWPGYIGQVVPYPANVPISGWTGSDPLRVGINPIADGQGPFANDGTIPEGDQVAFLQSVATQSLSTVISGLTPGETYTMAFRANRRNHGAVPSLRAYIDDASTLNAHVSSVGGTNPYKYVAFDFTAAATSQVFTITNDTAADCTLLVDDFQIAPSTTGWSFAEWTDDASSGVASSNNYSHAYNFGSPADPVINGVTFTGLDSLNPAVAGRFSTSGLGNRYNNDANALTSGGSAVLANDFIYRNGTAPEIIAIDGLVTGAEYETTIYGVAFDGPPATRAATFSVGEDRMTIDEDGFGDDTGIRVAYRGNADATGSLTLSYAPVNDAASFHTFGFSVREVAPAHAPVIYDQPDPTGTVYVGGDVSFSSLTGGMQPLFHQWRRDGSPLAGQTNRTLSLADVKLSDSGVYTLLVSNALGSVVSSNVVVSIGYPITTLFNSGVDDQGALLTDGVVDTHYTLVYSADPAWPGPDAYAATVIPGTYIANGPDSLYISPRTNLTGACEIGTYTYRTTFSMAGFSVADARIDGEWAVDNAGSDIVFNGMSLGLVNTAGYGSYTPFSIATGFVSGENTLEFVTDNLAAIGPTALRVRMTGVARPSNKGMVLIVR